MIAPVAFDFAPGNRLYVTEKAGRIRVVINGETERTPFLDISDRVNTYNDRGLVAIALDPDFPSQPYVYVSYTWDPPQTANGTGFGGPEGGGSRVSRVSRFTASAASDYKLAVPNSELILVGKNGTWENIINPNQDWRGALTCQYNDQPVQDCLPLDEHSHTVGMLKFAADGSLLISVGDASRSGDIEKYPSIRAQRKDFLLGKILRVNPANGQGLSDNPFFDGNPNSNISRVLYYGLRNPFRFTVRERDQRLFIGNVGWENWEEINTAPVGANFGWPCYEGGNGQLVVHDQHKNHPICQELYNNSSSVTAPVYGYQKQNGISVSVIMGDFASNTAWPNRYRGGLFFADYNRQVIEYLNFNAAGNVIGRNNFGTGLGGVTQISTGPDKDLYYTVATSGEVRVLRYRGGDPAPTARFSASRTTGPAPLLVRFDASATTDPDQDPLTYRWNFGDNSTGSGELINHTFQNEGNFTVRLTVTDDAGGSHSVSQEIFVGNKAPNLGFGAEAEELLRSTRYRVGETIAITGWGNDPEDGTLSGESLQWSAVIRHNDHTHPDLASGSGTTFYLPFPDHGENTFVQICLKVTDRTNLSARKCINAQPRDVEVTIDSQPRGIAIEYAGVTRVTPFKVASVSGGKRDITANLLTPAGLEFRRWSDGGSAAHTITVPDDPVVIKAFYGPGLTIVDSDNDGLSDAEEARWGTDPNTPDPDSDNDGTVNIVDSRPNDRRESGESFWLVPDIVDRSRRGFKYRGQSEYRSIMRAAFNNEGQDMSVRVRAWDMDEDGELSLWVSADKGRMKWIGNVRRGKNRNDSDRQIFYIPQSMLGDGRNWIEFRQKNPGEPWGISELMLKRAEAPQVRRLRRDKLYRTRYGYRYGSGSTVLRYVAPFLINGKRSDLELQLQSFDIDSSREVMVLLNGERVAFLRKTRNRKSRKQTIKLAKEKLRQANRIEFVQTNAPREAWGVTNIFVKEISE